MMAPADSHAHANARKAPRLVHRSGAANKVAKIKHLHRLMLIMMTVLVIELIGATLCMHLALDHHLASLDQQQQQQQRNDSARHANQHRRHHHHNHHNHHRGHLAQGLDETNALEDRAARPPEAEGKLGKSLMMLSDDKAELENEAAASTNVPKLNNMHRLLVRQLTNLIMNHEPERIAEHMEGAKISGQMVSESALDENDQPSSTGRTSWAVEGELMDLAGSAQMRTDKELNGQQQQLDLGAGNPMPTEQSQLQQQDGGSSSTDAGQVSSDDQLITCSPDYEDQTSIEGSGNLTAEQQQQLYADSSGLLVTQSGVNNNQSAPTTSTSTLGRANLNPGQCVHPGNRMIEFITKVVTPILFSIIIVVGLLGNIIVMLVILEDRKTERELTPTNLLILDLSLADLSFIIFCIPFTGWDYSVGHWVFGQAWCKCNQYLIVVCALSSIYTLVLMSVDRFMAIVYPIECISYRTSKNTLYAIYIKWIIILLIASPTISMHGLVELPLGEPDQYNCRFLIDQYNPLHFQIAFFITSYLFPLILIFCLYLSLLNKLWFGSKPHGHKESHKMLESKKKVTWLVAGIVVVFALCWCPIQVMLILMRLKSHRITATYVAIQVFSHILGYMNSCVNPIVYAFASETFHNSFKRSSFGRFFCRVCCCAGPSDRERSHSNATRLGATQNNTVTISLNQNKNLANPRRQSSNPNVVNRNGSLGDDNNLSATTLLITPYSSNNNSDNSKKNVALPLEPRDRGLPPIGSSNKSLDDLRTQVREAKGAKSSTGQQIASNQELSTSAPQSATPAKQQLVAHVVQFGNQVSHRCEPCYNENNQQFCTGD